MKRSRRPLDVRRIAMAKVSYYLDLAEKHPERSKRYAGLARMVCSKYNVRMPREYKRRICKSCGAFLTPGKNLRIRFAGKTMTYTCLECGGVARYRYQNH